MISGPIPAGSPIVMPMRTLSLLRLRFTGSSLRGDDSTAQGCWVLGVGCWVLGSSDRKPKTQNPIPPRASALNAVEKGYKLVAMTTQQDVHICDVCGAEMLEIHCKLICPRCGFTLDYSYP